MLKIDAPDRFRLVRQASGRLLGHSSGREEAARFTATGGRLETEGRASGPIQGQESYQGKCGSKPPCPESFTRPMTPRPFQALRSRRRRTSASTGGSTTDFDMISDMLPTSGANDEEDEDAIRELLRAVLKLFWVQTLDQLKGIEREEEMLKGAPPKSERKQAPGPPENDDAWRLDMPAGGRLLDEKGKVCVPWRTCTLADDNDRTVAAATVHHSPLSHRGQRETQSRRIPTGSSIAYDDSRRTVGNRTTAGEVHLWWRVRPHLFMLVFTLISEQRSIFQ